MALPVLPQRTQAFETVQLLCTMFSCLSSAHIFSVRATDGVQLQFGVNWQAVVLKNLFRLYSNVYEIAFQCVMRHSISCINPHAVSQFVLTRSLVIGVT